jgi:hypothetical protein
MQVVGVGTWAGKFMVILIACTLFTFGSAIAFVDQLMASVVFDSQTVVVQVFFFIGYETIATVATTATTATTAWIRPHSYMHRQRTTYRLATIFMGNGSNSPCISAFIGDQFMLGEV